MSAPRPARVGPAPATAGAGAAGALAGAVATGWVEVLDALPQPAWIARLADRRVVAVNAAALQWLALSREQALAVAADELAASPEDTAWWRDIDEGRPGALRSDTLLTLHDGRVRPVSRSLRALDAASAGTAAPGAGHALMVVEDRGAEQAAQAGREELLSDLQATLEATADGILVTDLDGGVRAFNRRFGQLWSLPAGLLRTGGDAALGGWLAQQTDDAERYAQRLLEIDRDGQSTTTDRLTLRDGRVFERVQMPLREDARCRGRVWSFRDLSASVAAEHRIARLTHDDPLTGLPNRHTLSTAVHAAVDATAQSAGGERGFALLVIDLDHFRRINEGLGQSHGDRVLLEVARRVQGCLRQHDRLARLGGDQFAVLLHGADAAGAEVAARRILRVVAVPCELGGAPFTLTCSVGVALAPAHGRDADELVRHAEAAMRQAKAAGRAGYRVHQRRAEVDRRGQMKLDHAMRQALACGRFRLHYQPQVRLDDGSIQGAEALLRWRDPELGEVSPARFIPAAEDSGFIVEIGDWVLGQAVRQAALWHQRGLSLPVAVNISAMQFQQAQFIDRIGEVLAVSGLPPRLLALELTESILVRDAEDALRRLRQLAGLGVQLAIDDFGIGYSSLSYLKRFPIGKLKIDRSFVKELPLGTCDAGIVRAILQMARALGMRVTAEGVETEAQRRFLQQEGCDDFQGFLFAPALDAPDFEALLGASPAPTPVPVPPAPPMRLVRA